MVLQRSPYKAVLWGYTSDITNAVTLTVGTEKYECDTSIGPTGKPIWNATIDPMTEFGPFDITVSTATSNATIRDVLFGDVWLCSGQSNMQFTIRQAGNPIVDCIFNITEPKKKTYCGWIFKVTATTLQVLPLFFMYFVAPLRNSFPTNR